MKDAAPDSTLKELCEMVSDREYFFCHNYLLSLNQTKAAIDAGFSDRTARQQAGRMMARPEIKKIISILSGEREKRLQVKQDNVLRHIGYVAFSDPRKAFDENNALMSPSKWPDEIAYAISSVKILETRTVDGNIVGQTKEIKFLSRIDALNLAARHLGMLNDKITVDVSDQLADRLARARQRLNE